MLPERHNLEAIGSVQIIKGAADTFIANSGDVRRVGEQAPSFVNEINKAVGNFDFGRNVKQLAHIFHVVPLSATATLWPPLGEVEQPFNSIQSLSTQSFACAVAS